MILHNFKLVLVVILWCSFHVDGNICKSFFRKDYTYIPELKSFYRVSKEQADWYDAKKRCALEGALLWIPENEKEVKAVAAEWNKTVPDIKGVFIGFSDLVSEGIYRNIDGRSLDEVYHVWQDGEPNNRDNKEDCGMMWNWLTVNDYPCNHKLHFVCKKTLDSLEWNLLCNLPDRTYNYFNEVGKCYKLHQRPKTWTEASATCNAEQSYLAVINSQHEANVLAKFYADSPKENCEEPIYNNSLHIGFHNPDGEDWVTVEGIRLETSGYAKWEQSQPDNCTLINNCGGMDTNAELHDVGCEQVSFFICEHDVEGLNSSLYNRFGNGRPFFRKDYTYMPELKSFYRVSRVQTNWFYAKKRCALEGAVLWIPENEEEVKAVVAEWKKTEPNINTVFIGFNDLVSEGIFETIDKRSLDEVYHVWGNGEPNDVGDVEDCGMLSNRFTLNDVPCDSKLSYVCKKTLDSLEWNVLCNLPDRTYNYFNGKCYKLHQRPKSWAEAYATCNAEQSYLAVINSQHEANMLAKFYADTPNKMNYKGPINRNSLHIGFHNPDGEDWVTVKGIRLEESGYDKWEQSQPDNYTLVNNCGGMDTNAELHDVNCEEVSFFICEHDVEGPNLSLDERFVASFDKYNTV